MKIISQSTFDNVVLENVLEFENSLEEAIKEASEEFQAQGVQLMGIVKNPRLSADKSRLIHDILESLYVIKSSEDESEISKSLKIVTEQCKLSLAHRILATEHGGYKILLDSIKKFRVNCKLLSESLQAMAALTFTNSDILTADGMDVMMELLSEWETKTLSSSVPEHLAAWCLECCLKHENNRQHLVEGGAQGKIVGLLNGHRNEARVVRICLRAIRAFSLDDDIRAEFGKAHDHARLLVEEHSMIKVCLELMKDYLHDNAVASEILSTLTRLCVRAEYCQHAVDHGALVTINDILISFPDDKNLNKQAINLMKTISGNDKVKDEAMSIGGSQLIIAAMTKHQLCEGVCEACLGAISMLALRSIANAKQLGLEGALDAVVQVMKLHPDHKKIQVIGCMAVRNLGARVPENKAALILCQVESVIHAAMEKFGDSVLDVGKAALRDLDLEVKLVEQWKGLGVQMQQ